MADEEQPFKFLTNEEFNRLSQTDKMNYLAGAVAALNERTNSRVRLFAPSKTRPKPKSA